MAIDSIWRLENQAMLTTFEGHITLADLEDYDRLLHSVLVSLSNPISVVIDLNSLDSFPADWSNVAATAHALRHPNLADITLVYRRDAAKLTPYIALLERAFGLPVTVVSHLDEIGYGEDNARTA